MPCFALTQFVASKSWAIAQDRDAIDCVNANCGLRNKPCFELNSNHWLQGACHLLRFEMP